MEPRHEWLSLDEAAGVLKVGVPTVQSLINRGLLQAEQHGDQTRVAYAALVAFLRADQRTLLDTGGQPPDLGLTGSDDGDGAG